MAGHAARDYDRVLIYRWRVITAAKALECLQDPSLRRDSMPRLAALFLILVSAAVSADDDIARTIAVNGFGTAETTPDRAMLTLSIDARESTVAAAQAKAAEVTARVLELADAMDIPENRVDTMAAIIRPDYRWNRDTNTQDLIGYVAQRQMRLEVHDLDKVGLVIERAVEVGVNQVSPPRLMSSRSREVYRDALEKAVEDARQNAERLADALGLSLGDAVQVNAGSPTRPPIPMNQGAALAIADPQAQTYTAGDLTVIANVNVVFEASP